MWLTPSQEEIAAIKEGIHAVFAGAGSGKTATLTARVQQLIQDGVEPSKIVVCTFTRKAAEEIKERIANDSVVCGTMHSICLSWLREAPKLAGYQFGVKSVLSEAELKALVEGRKKPDAAMREAMSIGFDEIISTANRILSVDPSAVIEEGTHFIVDEAQDNSNDQWELVNRVAASGLCASVMVVGDFRQSIYEWRNASPQAGMEFCEQEVVTKRYLHENFRSAPEIVEMANRVAAVGGYEEPMVAARTGLEGEIKFAQVPSVAAYISHEIDRLACEFVPYSDMAVLCRYNREADAVTAYLDGEGVPVSRAKAVDRNAIDRFCAWANWMANHYSTHSMKVFLGSELPKESVAKLCADTKKYMTDPVREIIYNSKSLAAYRSVERCIVEGEAVPKNKSLNAWLLCGGTQEEWSSFIEPLVGEKLSDVSELLNVQCKSPEIKRTGVAITTAHAAKGLEWPYVFVVGASQDQMPGAKSGWRRNEELRLLYVEITRAIKGLHVVIDETSKWSEFLCDEHGRPIT